MTIFARPANTVIGFFVLCPLVNAQIGAPPSTPQPMAQPLPLSGRQQNGSVVSEQTPALTGGSNSVNTLNPSLQVQGVYQGSVPRGAVSTTPIALSLEDAVRRGIQYNLGAISANDAAKQARAQQLGSLAQLLPDITGNALESVQKSNLAALGLRLNLPIPGFHFPSTVGPFNYFDAGANFSESLSLTALRNWESSRENNRSAQLLTRDSRELVALAISASYLQAIAAGARIETADAQVATAKAVYEQAMDRNRSGLNATIDVNRSLVELQTQQQRLTTLTNDFEKQKILLARVIGLPMAQKFTFSDSAPYREAPAPNVDDMILRAFAMRADVQAAAAQVKAAQFSRKAAVAEFFPSFALTGEYGVMGVNPSRDAHGTFSVNGAVDFPIFRSGRIRAQIDQADAVLAQRNSEYEDAKGRAEQDVRLALLDWAASAQQVQVAQSNRGLARQTLEQARDRFRAGVTDTVEVVQGQESVATAEQDYISALYAFNLAQVSLGRATGQTEQGIARMLQGK